MRKRYPATGPTPAAEDADEGAGDGSRNHHHRDAFDDRNRFDERDVDDADDVDIEHDEHDDDDGHDVPNVPDDPDVTEANVGDDGRVRRYVFADDDRRCGTGQTGPGGGRGPKRAPTDAKLTWQQERRGCPSTATCTRR